MQVEAAIKSVRLFRFGVPSHSDMQFGVSLAEVIEVTQLPHILPVPHSAPFVIGLSLWHERVIPIIDLAGALQGRSADHHHHDDAYLIARMAGSQEQEILAWPILPGAGVIEVPSMAEVTAAPTEFQQGSLLAAFASNEQTLFLLNLVWLMTPGYRH